MRDAIMSDHFKTLREPLIEQQKKTDAKQDKVIEQLKKKQLALTSRIQDIMTLNVELAQITPEEMQELPQITSEGKKEFVANIENKFDAEDKQIMDKLGLIQPSELMNVDDLEKYQEDVKKVQNQIPYEIGGLKKKKDQDGVEAKIKEKEREKDIINLKTYYLKPKTGKGAKYKQPKRNAYKINGGLMIDLPKLLNEMKLNAYRGGKLVYQSDVDKSLINLLTKRYNPKTKYSINAVSIFNDLNSLSNMLKHRSSGKSRMVGSSMTYYNNANELADRMKILVGSMTAGNNSPVLKNDLWQINDELLKLQAIDKSMHEKFYQKYLS